MSNFGMTQNVRLSSIHRKHSRTTNVQKQEQEEEEDENIFEKNTSFVSSSSSSSSEKKDVKINTTSLLNKLNLNNVKSNRTVIKSVDHH